MTIICDFQLHRDAFKLHFQATLSDHLVTSIVGPSGSGKSTILRHMAGLEFTKSGYFSFYKKIFQEGDYFVPAERRNIGYVGASTKLFPLMTAYQNIQFAKKRAYPCYYPLPDIDSMITLFDVEECLSKKADQLSTGQAQRIKLIQSIANCPSLFLLDEALSANDWARKQKILKYLKSYLKSINIPAVFVSHDQAEIEIISDGMISI